MNRPVDETPGISQYIGDLCSNVTSCAIFVDFIGLYESRYQALFAVGERDGWDVAASQQDERDRMEPSGR